MSVFYIPPYPWYNPAQSGFGTIIIPISTEIKSGVPRSSYMYKAPTRTSRRYSKQCLRRESNPRPHDHETDALTLHNRVSQYSLLIRKFQL